MNRSAWCTATAAAALALACLAAQAAPDEASGGPEASLAPALRGQVFQRSRPGFEPRPGGEASALQMLARGTLWRAQLDEDTSLSLRLRGGKLGLVLAVRFNSGGG